MTLKGSCHCGAVQFSLSHRPAQFTECNCSVCCRYGHAGLMVLPGQSTSIVSPVYCAPTEGEMAQLISITAAAVAA